MYQNRVFLIIIIGILLVVTACTATTQEPEATVTLATTEVSSTRSTKHTLYRKIFYFQKSAPFIVSLNPQNIIKPSTHSLHNLSLSSC
jgi:ABC-type Fe3+-hydroxamate transport system substrate-binding protein